MEENNIITQNDMPSEKDVLIDIANVSMRYKLPSEKIDNLKEYFIKLLKGKIKYKDFWVLKNINLQINRGESLGLIGRNGAGKSTLLRLIAGIMEPTSGAIATHGSMVPLLKLGAGFDTNATGRENIYLNGAILGYSKKEMAAKYKSIVAFSELEKFMDVPLKNYSSGMLTRLGFSIAVDVHPEILLIDEVLAVGDAPFQKKCADKIEELQKAGTTFIVVSHSMNQIKKLCQKAVWLKGGKIFMYGDSNTVGDAYLADCNDNPART
jgi:ABC-type polysaccharide/polyol phosphate transport system ATPase subunit